jgi:beta-galactosidase
MRQTLRFNNGWRFQSGDARFGIFADFDDSFWRPVMLPHDWSIEGPFDPKWASATGYLPGGQGWYRKRFSVPYDFPPGQVYLHFDGVYCNSEVWINGHSLGVRPNGFVSFRYDVTEFINMRGSNVIAVKVDHTQFGDARWYTGSGIYRNVYLIGTGPVHLKQWGVGVTTPTVSPESAEVVVTATIENHNMGFAAVQAAFTLRDIHGETVAEAIAEIRVTPRGEDTATATLTVENPSLWSVDSPNLYSLHTVLHQGGTMVDEEEIHIGIRTIRFDPNEGFFLNDVNLKLKGVCVHDDAGALGVAVPPKVWKRRLQTLKEAGVNAIRMAHNPHMPELYDLCDQMGLLVQDEAFDEWERGKNKWIEGWNVGTPGQDGYHSAFAEWADTDLKDMILRDRNHPSVIMWSIGNEIDYPNDPYSHEALDVGTNPQIYGRGFNPDLPHSNRLGEVARHLVEVAKSVDTTRPITAALSAALISVETGFGAALDVVGYNYQEGRYADDHARFPEWVIYGSENGMLLKFWRAVADNPSICGQFLWTGIDYLGEAGKWPTRSNGAGLLDLAGFPKPEYYFRQSLWSAEPMIYLGTREMPAGADDEGLWTHVKAEPVWQGTPGVPVRVNCFTNCEIAELFVNDHSMGLKSTTPEDPRLHWDVPFAPGTLRVEARNGGAVAAAATLTSAGPAARILAHVDDAIIAADGIDMAHIEVQIVDEAGVLVHDSDAEVTWAVEGAVRLLGIESGDPNSHEDYHAPKRKAFKGRMLGYLQSRDTGSGSITVTLTSPDLESATLVLKAIL